MSIYIEQESYKNNQFSKYCASFENSFIHSNKLTIKKLTQIISLWKRRYQQRKALAKLDQRMLEDIGYSHQQVQQEIAKPFWK